MASICRDFSGERASWCVNRSFPTSRFTSSTKIGVICRMPRSLSLPTARESIWDSVRMRASWVVSHSERSGAEYSLWESALLVFAPRMKPRAMIAIV